MGATIAIIGRDTARTEATAQELRDTTAQTAHAFVADLSSQTGIRRVANEIVNRLPRLHVLVNVSGYLNSRHTTADGLERTVAVNHLAP